jgi:hypothetical protein
MLAKTDLDALTVLNAGAFPHMVRMQKSFPASKPAGLPLPRPGGRINA